MGTLALGIMGIYSLLPLLLKILSPISQLVWKIFGLDPSIVPSSIFALDMGGYQLSKNIAINSELGAFMGIIVDSTLEATVSFTLPIAFSMVQEKDKEQLAKGIMIGIISIPIGCMAAGICLGVDTFILLWNMTPIAVFSILLSIGLLKAPNLTTKIFKCFGKFIIGLSTIGLLFQAVYLIYGYKIGDFLIPFEETMSLVGKIAIILGGAYPMLEAINRVLRKPLDRLGEKLGVSLTAITAMIGNLASNLLVFGNLKHMNEKGKVMYSFCSKWSIYIWWTTCLCCKSRA